MRFLLNQIAQKFCFYLTQHLHSIKVRDQILLNMNFKTSGKQQTYHILNKSNFLLFINLKFCHKLVVFSLFYLLLDHFFSISSRDVDIFVRRSKFYTQRVGIADWATVIWAVAVAGVIQFNYTITFWYVNAALRQCEWLENIDLFRCVRELVSKRKEKKRLLRFHLMNRLTRYRRRKWKIATASVLSCWVLGRRAQWINSRIWGLYDLPRKMKVKKSD